MIKKFSLPSWYIHHEKLMLFLRFYSDNKDLFFNDRIIDSVYDVYNGGNIPLIWGGGRYSLADSDKIPMNFVLSNFKRYPGIEIRHVFTNMLLDSDELLTEYRCNKFVQQCIRPNDSVVLNHPKLIQYFKETYPKIKIIYSTTMNITDIDKVNELTKDNMYVLNYNYNNNNEYLEKLQHKENIEILCAEPCQPFCPHRLKHYKAISQNIINLNNFNVAPESDFVCPFGAEPFTLDEIMAHPHAITNERVEELSKQGFQYFKISGRTVPVPQWFDTILYYLAKPKYRTHIRSKLLCEWWLDEQAKKNRIYGLNINSCP